MFTQCKIAIFHDSKIKINRDIIEIIQNFVDLIYVFLYRCLQKANSEFDMYIEILVFFLVF